MMVPSKEIRWFTKAENKEILRWFEKHNMSFSGTKPRVDFYLDTEKKNMGIKLRDGNIEIKEKLERGKLETLSATIEGIYEDWNKWSFELNEKDELSKSIINDSNPNWIEVKKERMGLILTRDSHGDNVLMNIIERVDFGCQIEYTRLTIENEVFYTFGFEWFGKKTIGLEQGLLNQIIGTSSLDIVDSFSYPEFLNKLNLDSFIASDKKNIMHSENGKR